MKQNPPPYQKTEQPKAPETSPNGQPRKTRQSRQRTSDRRKKDNETQKKQGTEKKEEPYDIGKQNNTATPEFTTTQNSNKPRHAKRKSPRSRQQPNKTDPSPKPPPQTTNHKPTGESQPKDKNTERPGQPQPSHLKKPLANAESKSSKTQHHQGTSAGEPMGLKRYPGIPKGGQTPHAYGTKEKTREDQEGETTKAPQQTGRPPQHKEGTQRDKANAHDQDSDQNRTANKKRQQPHKHTTEHRARPPAHAPNRTTETTRKQIREPDDPTHTPRERHDRSAQQTLPERKETGKTHIGSHRAPTSPRDHKAYSSIKTLAAKKPEDNGT
ncbi:hypothetical protein ARMSODRAFT_983966 [Armillaria solidipes]|uniref:Uncharacterized protein n=1 Tax=Armillaria solidipes TaxID=1076256 RepID=A0A2H3AWY2_9AGAR|nr:hypothetical protein ARMSODRAFT_983966 [Armillaria solidipes]